jgi:Zn-dependent protease
MRQWIHVGNVSRVGAPVYVHWSVFIVVAGLGLLSLKSPIYAALTIGCYFAVIAIHEIGHALVARRLGYDVLAIHISIIHGVCVLEEPETEWEAVLISWGGVVAQVCVAAAVLVVAKIVDGLDLPYFGVAVVFLGYLNLMIAFVNLAPGPGMDGETAWRIVPLSWRQWRANRTARRALHSIAKRR